MNQFNARALPGGSLALSGGSVDSFCTSGPSPTPCPSVTEGPLQISASTGVFPFPKELALHHGGLLSTTRLSFARFGSPELPAVLVLGGISADRQVVSHSGSRASGWWDDFVGGAQDVVDLNRYQVVGVDYIGGKGTSTNPANYYSSEGFPSIATRDQAHAIALLTERLDIASWHAVIGSSYGGMVGLALAARFPRLVNRLVTIGAAHQSAVMTTAVRSVQRQIVRLGLRCGQEREALACARALAVTSYRDAGEFEQRFGGEPERQQGHWRFPVDGYLEHQGQKFSDSFSAAQFLALSESLDLHRIDPGLIQGPLCTHVAISSDRICPPHQVAELAAATGGELVRIDSIYGHDAFLKEAEALRGPIQAALAKEVHHDN